MTVYDGICQVGRIPDADSVTGSLSDTARAAALDSEAPAGPGPDHVWVQGGSAAGAAAVLFLTVQKTI